MSKENGGAAFPSPGVVIDFSRNEHQQGAYEGMSLRDYFAAKALSGMLADPTLGRGCGDVASIAYLFADAMLAAREVSK